jgi:hypothetical protein
VQVLNDLQISAPSHQNESSPRRTKPAGSPVKSHEIRARSLIGFVPGPRGLLCFVSRNCAPDDWRTIGAGVIVRPAIPSNPVCSARLITLLPAKSMGFRAQPILQALHCSELRREIGDDGLRFLRRLARRASPCRRRAAPSSACRA